MTCVFLYVCGENLHLSGCMWKGLASLYMFVGRNYVSLCVCGGDVHSPPGVYVCGGDLHSSLEGNSVESGPMLLHVQPFSSCSQNPKNYTAREEGFISAYICANIYTAGDLRLGIQILGVLQCAAVCCSVLHAAKRRVLPTGEYMLFVSMLDAAHQIAGHLATQ